VRGDVSSWNLKRVGVGASALLGASLLAACGDYDPETPAAGGTTTTSNQPNNPANGGGGPVATGAGGSGGSQVTPVDASCNNTTACGGDVVGTWVAAGSCLPVSGQADMSGFGLGCTAAPLTGALEVSGTWIANPDGTFTDQTATSGDSQIDLPADCLNVSGTITTCDRLDGALQALGYASVTCMDSASGGCTCAATVQQMGSLGFVTLDTARSGTYAAADNMLTASARNQTQYAYCVSGTTLTLTPQTVGRTGTVAGTIVLQRQ
jgi:hypothetical protein